MEIGLYLDIIIYFGILSQTTWADVENIGLACNETRELESPNYPNDYGINANIIWNIAAPESTGIAVVFNEFNTEEGHDILSIQDPERSISSREYSGEPENIPPFLSTRSSLLITFQSSASISRKGFSLELHCYETSDRKSNIKLKSSTRANEGILKVLNANTTNEWLPVCDESWNSLLAERTCTQLGFPGVYHFASEVDEQYNKSICANINCDKSDFLLQQCDLKLDRQDSMNASRLNCFTFGYLGCFPLPTNPDTLRRSNTTEVGDCLHTCSVTSFQLAAIRWDGCYCLNDSQSRIHIEISEKEKCILECDTSQGTECPPSGKTRAFHYDVTIGFCEHPGDVAHGWWSSNHTYLGSRLTLTCQPGYVVNGSKTIDCKPRDADKKIEWDHNIPHCQSLKGTLQPITVAGTPTERTTTPIAYTLIVILSVAGGALVVVMIFSAVVWCQKRKVRGSFTNKQSTVKNGPTTSSDDSSRANGTPETLITLTSTQIFSESTNCSDDSSLANVTPFKSTSQVVQIEPLISVTSTQICSESSNRNGLCEETVGENPKQGESSSSALTQIKSHADVNMVYATVNKGREDHQNSSTAEVDKRETRADGILEGSDERVEISVKYPQQTSCGKSHTMRNRPLPQCPKDGAIKPPIAPRKAQTLTRKDQTGASDFSMNTSKENLPPSTAPRDRGHVNKKAPGGSTPYVKARGKRAKKVKNKGDHLVQGVSCDDSAVSAPKRLSDVSSSAYSTIDHSPEKGNLSSLDKTEKAVSSNNNSNSILQVIDFVPPEQVYFDINDTNGDEESKGSMIGGASGLNGIFGDDVNPSTTAVQPASNLYHTLEPTNAEYEDIRNSEAKFNGNGAYDLLNF